MVGHLCHQGGTPVPPRWDDNFMRADTELNAGKRTTCRQALHDFGGTPAPEGHYAAPLVAVLIFSYFCIGAEKGGKKEKGKRRKEKVQGQRPCGIQRRATPYGEVQPHPRKSASSAGNNGKQWEIS